MCGDERRKDEKKSGGQIVSAIAPNYVLETRRRETEIIIVTGIAFTDGLGIMQWFLDMD